MKKIIFLLIIVILEIPGFSQGWVSISGTVYNSENGTPVPRYPVTIIADSANGVFYYNTVLTDSLGYYQDGVPFVADSTAIINVQTPDCNGLIINYPIIIYSQITSYTQDFYICVNSIPCEANFDFYPEPGGAPDSFRFTDLSTGDIFAWFWNFGDSAFSQEQNPYHVFPGPGTYETCLTVSGNNCSSTFCQIITISDTVYRQLYGQVFAGDFPLQQGVVNLFALNPGGGSTLLEGGFPVDSNGIYYFTLVPEGIYLIQAVPADSTAYLPTYFGDVIDWQQATQISIGEPANPYNINLVVVREGFALTGPGSISGHINTNGLRMSPIDQMNILLLDSSYTALGFSGVSSQGYFSFPSVPYGTYFIRAELSGVTSELFRVDVDLISPEAVIILNYTGSSVLDIAEGLAPGEVVSIFPNPFIDRFLISLNMNFPGKCTAGIYSLSGQLLRESLVVFSQGENTINLPVEDIPDGLYILRLVSERFSITKRIVKSGR